MAEAAIFGYGRQDTKKRVKPTLERLEEKKSVQQARGVSTGEHRPWR